MIHVFQWVVVLLEPSPVYLGTPVYMVDEVLSYFLSALTGLDAEEKKCRLYGIVKPASLKNLLGNL